MNFNLDNKWFLKGNPGLKRYTKKEMTSVSFAKKRDLSRTRVNLTGHVTEAINVFIIESALKLPLKNASVNSLKHYTALSSYWSVLFRYSIWATSSSSKNWESMADRIGESEDNTAPQSSSSCKPYLYFSIENILSNETFGSQKKTRKESAQKNGSPTIENIGKSSMQTLFMRLPWLAYTRYCPPKIPSK